MQAGDIVAAIDLGTSRTAYAYTVVGREHIWLGVPDSPDDDRNVSGAISASVSVGVVAFVVLLLLLRANRNSIFFQASKNDPPAARETSRKPGRGLVRVGPVDDGPPSRQRWRT